MYDELVTQCRDCIDCLCGDCKYEHLQKPGNFVPCMNALLGEAADAIEELLTERDEVNADSWKTAFEIERDEHRWIPVTDRLPSDFVSVQAHLVGADPLPTVREAYVIGGKWFFPALKEFLPVDMWKRFDEPPKEG